MSTLKVSTISPLGTDATKTITIGSAGDTIAGMATNTPAFFVTKSSNQSISSGSWTKATFDTEDFDTDSAFANSAFTVPSGKAGKYYFHSSIRGNGTDGTMDYLIFRFYKNGSEVYTPFQLNVASNQLKNSHIFGAATFDLSVGDYIEVYVQMSGSSLEIAGNTNPDKCYFGGYRLIGA